MTANLDTSFCVRKTVIPLGVINLNIDKDVI